MNPDDIKMAIKSALLSYWRGWVPQYSAKDMLTAYGNDQSDEDDKTNLKLSDIGFTDVTTRACWHEYCNLVSQYGGQSGAVRPQDAQNWGSNLTMKGIVLAICGLLKPVVSTLAVAPKPKAVRKPR